MEKSILSLLKKKGKKKTQERAHKLKENNQASHSARDTYFPSLFEPEEWSEPFSIGPFHLACFLLDLNWIMTDAYTFTVRVRDTLLSMELNKIKYNIYIYIHTHI